MVFRDEIPRSPPPLEDSLYRLGISPCPMVGWSDGIPSPINPVVIKYPNHPTSFATLDISWPWHIMKMHINAIQKKNHTCLAQKFPKKAPFSHWVSDSPIWWVDFHQRPTPCSSHRGLIWCHGEAIDAPMPVAARGDLLGPVNLLRKMRIDRFRQQKSGVSSRVLDHQRSFTYQRTEV
jgi:hypothetical protein